MKFRRIVFLFIIAALLFAFFTNPKESDFTEFIQAQAAKVSSPPLIEYENHLIYSQAAITYYNPTTVDGRIMAEAGKDTYIGLFGRFWKTKP